MLSTSLFLQAQDQTTLNDQNVNGADLSLKPSQELNIFEFLTYNPNFSILVKAIQAADLVNTLKSKGPFTIFAPVNSAFMNLPPGTWENLMKPENKEKLKEVLTYHIIPEKLQNRDIKNESIQTINGKNIDITVQGNMVMVNNAQVINLDMDVANGVIHGINAVLIP